MYAVGDGFRCDDAESSAYRRVCSALFASHGSAEAVNEPSVIAIHDGGGHSPSQGGRDTAGACYSTTDNHGHHIDACDVLGGGGSLMHGESNSLS